MGGKTYWGTANPYCGFESGSVRLLLARATISQKILRSSTHPICLMSADGGIPELNARCPMSVVEIAILAVLRATVVQIPTANSIAAALARDPVTTHLD